MSAALITPSVPQGAPSVWVTKWAHLIGSQGSHGSQGASGPTQGAKVLDLACGSGRHMKWLSEQGFDVLGLDKDASALALCKDFGRTMLCDLELEATDQSFNPLEGLTFDAVVVTNYLHRPLFPALLASLRDGAVLIYETFSMGQQSIGRPKRAEFLLQSGELLEMCKNLHIVAYEDVFLEDPQRYVQRIVAVRLAKEVSPDLYYRATSR